MVVRSAQNHVCRVRKLKITKVLSRTLPAVKTLAELLHVQEFRANKVTPRVFSLHPTLDEQSMLAT